MGKIKSKIGDNVVLHNANRNMQDDIKKCIDKYEVSHANDCINLLQVHGQGGGRTVNTHGSYRLDQVFEGVDNTVIINVQQSNLTFCQVVVKPNILDGLDNDVRIILPETIMLQNINQNNVQAKLTLIRNFKN